METKGVTCKIPLDLHNRIIEEIRQNDSTMSKFIEQIILEHYTKGATTMGKTRTLAFQVSEELFQQIKDYLARYEQVYHRKLSQKEFVIGLIEQALEQADEEFAAAEDAADESEDYGQENGVTSDDETNEDTQPDDTPEGNTQADAALASRSSADADDDSLLPTDADGEARCEWQ